MGSFGYICRGCGTPINGKALIGGEKCIMMHVRHGKVLGKTEGHYDEYGRVVEDAVFRNNDKNNINSHEEICKSEYNLMDSYNVPFKMYRGKRIIFAEYIKIFIQSELGKHNYCINENSVFYPYVNRNIYNSYYYRYLHCLKIKDAKGAEEIKDNMRTFVGVEIVGKTDILVLIAKEFDALPKGKGNKSSGIVAWHSYCYNHATEEERKDLTPSKPAPNQSWGRIRKKYE